METQWDRGDDVSTEDLRMALHRYRSFFNRLLGDVTQATRPEAGGCGPAGGSCYPDPSSLCLPPAKKLSS